MGMSSSQARLLTLTARMHDIEYKASRLEAQKLQMANDSARVYNEYLNALEAIKIQSKSLNPDGSVTYVDASYKSLIGKVIGDEMYLLTDIKTGKIYLPKQYKTAYECSNKTLDGFLTTLNNISSDKNENYSSVSSVEDLMAMQNSSGMFRLDEDLVLTDWTGINNFSGTFDGNGHTITITGESGLFNNVNGATLENVSIKADICNDTSSLNYTGGLVNYATNVNVNNCYVEADIYSQKRMTGGLIGVLNGNSTINNSDTCVNIICDYTSVDNGNTTQDYFGRCGGFIGYTVRNSNIEINDCSSSGGSVKYSYWQAGGFLGQSNGNVTLNRCYVDNDIVINYNGKGDDYVESYSTGTTEYTVPHSGATFIGFINTGNLVANNCNVYGSVSTGGSTNLEAATYSYANIIDSKTFNECYSDMSDTDWQTVPNDFSNITSNYPNIDESVLNDAIGIFKAIENSNGVIYPSEENINSTVWLSNMINSGSAVLLKVGLKNNKIFDTSVATDTNLREVNDEALLKKAEAKYEADMKKIDLKDRKYDTDLAALETERNAIKQEMETLKTAAKDNVERTFKLFS